MTSIRRSSCVQVIPCIAILGTLSLAAGPASAENWPGWRGPAGTGVSGDADLPLKWSADQNVCWHAPLPDRGNSTPIVWGDRVFVTQAIEKDHRRTLMCVDRREGRLLWQSGVTYDVHEPTNAQNPYCSSSPVTDGRHVVAYFGSAGLFCYDFDGKELWRRDVGKVDSWQGSGSSPVIYHELGILNAGPGSNAAIIACNLANGEIAWKATLPADGGEAAKRAETRPAEDRSADEPVAASGGKSGFDNAMMSADPSGAGGFLGSWSTPVVVHVHSRDELIVVQSYRVNAYDPQSGRELWTCAGLPEQAFASPAIGDGVLVAMGHILSGGGTRITAVRLGGDTPATGSTSSPQASSGPASSTGQVADITTTHRLWQTDLRKECVGSGVVVNGHVYLVTQFGSAVCLDLATGKKQWEKRLTGQGSGCGSWSSLVLADGKLLVPNQAGEVFILKAQPKFELLSSNLAAEETTCASLAVSDGQIFLRTYNSLWCFGRVLQKLEPSLHKGR